MSRTIIVRNMSGSPQEFEVHGWNNNQNMTVPANSEQYILAPDGSSGAIIALHDGCEGEQAEITKNGWGGNDFFDVSVIVGAGGNMVVQQVGDNGTRKGAPRFMQELNDAWSALNEDQRNNLRDCVHERDGRVVRISACKDFPKLEDFVRTFANGKAYIGIGAWNGNLGNVNDNNQSSGANGNKDILVCYNDGDATPHSDINSLSIEAVGDKEIANLDPSIVMTEPSPLALSSPLAFMSLNVAVDQSGGEPGIDLTNQSDRETEYFFYDNYWNGNGTAGANFDHPLTSVKLAPGQNQFVPLPASFKGRVQRGTQLPATWVEFQLEAADDHGAHGDISLQQGCDGAATIASTDGSNVINGLGPDLVNVVANAPQESIRNKPNGERAIDTTVGNWNGGPNQAAIDYLNGCVGQSRAYILGGTGVPDVASRNKRLAVVMY